MRSSRLLASLSFAVLFPAAAALANAPAPGGGAITLPQPSDRVFEARLPGFDAEAYDRAVEGLIAAFERSVGRRFAPSTRRRAGLKVYSDSGAGLSTPVELVLATVRALERRGFARGDLRIVGLNAARLRAAGFLPPLSEGGSLFHGVPVLVLEDGRYFEDAWFYDSPLPARRPGAPSDFEEGGELAMAEGDRRSFLPAPLLFDVDFWINLPGCSDHPVLGVNGALVNATLWNASNTQRFFRSPANAPAAVAEIGAIPELRAGWVFNLMSLQRYQFIGGPVFNSLYTLSEPLLWLSDNPVLLDALMWERIDRGRRAAGFRGLPDGLRLLSYASQLGLGGGDRTRVEWIPVPVEGAIAGP